MEDDRNEQFVQLEENEEGGGTGILALDILALTAGELASRERERGNVEAAATLERYTRLAPKENGGN